MQRKGRMGRHVLRPAGLLLALALVASCQEEQPDEDLGLTNFAPEAMEQARAQCVEQGGSWGRGGITQGYVCTRRTADANQPCRSGSECEGLCLARSRTCAPVTPFFGCHDILQDGGTPATICID